MPRQVLTGCKLVFQHPGNPENTVLWWKTTSRKRGHQSRHPGWGSSPAKEAIRDHQPGQVMGWLQSSEWGQGTGAKETSRSIWRFWGMMSCCFKPLRFRGGLLHSKKYRIRAWLLTSHQQFLESFLRTPLSEPPTSWSLDSMSDKDPRWFCSSETPRIDAGPGPGLWGKWDIEDCFF